VGLVADVNRVFLERLRSDSRLTDKVYMGRANDMDADEPNDGDEFPPIPLPYVMVFSDDGEFKSDRASDDAVNAEFTFTVNLVGDTTIQIQAMADVVNDLLLDWRPNVPGRRSWKARKSFSTPNNMQDELMPALIYTVADWSLRSTKGKTDVRPSP